MLGLSTTMASDGDTLNETRVLIAHVATCHECEAAASTCHPCTTLAALSYLLLMGHDPRDWSTDPTLPQRKLTPRQQQQPALRPTAKPDRQFLQDKAQVWKERGVLQEAPDGATATPVFVIRKATPAAGSEGLFAAWMLKQPPEVIREWAEGRGFQVAPPYCKVKLRPIFDLRAVNARHCVQLRMKFRSTTEACALMTEGCSLAAADYSEGYTSVKVTAKLHDLVSQIGGTNWMHRCLPFGYWAAPAIFCLLSGEVAAQCQTLFLEDRDGTMTYNDDTLVVLTGTDEEKAAKFQHVVEHMRYTGFRVHPDKLQLPASTVEYLGTVLRSTPRGAEIALPIHKAKGLAIMLDLACSYKRWPQKFWDRLLGKLQAASPIMLGSGPRIGSVRAACHSQKWMTSGAFGMVDPGDDARASLRWLAAAVDTNEGTSTRMWAPVTVVGTGTAFTDASGEGGLGGVLLLTHTGAPTAEPVAFSLRTPQSAAFADNKYSTLLEFLAILEATRRSAAWWSHARPSAAAQRFLLTVTTDNQAVTALWRRGYSNRATTVNEIIATLVDLCTRSHIVLTIDWVPREHNQVADALSHPHLAHTGAVQEALRGRTAFVSDLPRLLATQLFDFCR